MISLSSVPTCWTATACGCKTERPRCYRPDWLAEEDVNHLGFRPKRTYVGYQYQGGFSDHWPVYLQLRQREAEVAEK